MLDLALALLIAAPDARMPTQDDVPIMEAARPIDAAAFMVGRWVGTGMGGDVEEVWSPAQGGQMVGHFTYSQNGAVVFYEILLVRPNAEGGLEMLVKHFNADFTAWEEKSEWVTFRAEGVELGRLRFKGLTVELEGDTLTATVTMRNNDGTVNLVPFVMQRASD